MNRKGSERGKDETQPPYDLISLAVKAGDLYFLQKLIPRAVLEAGFESGAIQDPAGDCFLYMRPKFHPDPNFGVSWKAPPGTEIDEASVRNAFNKTDQAYLLVS